MNVDDAVVDLVVTSHNSGLPVKMRRTHSGGRIRIEKGYLHFLPRKIDVNHDTYEAVKAALYGETRK